MCERSVVHVFVCIRDAVLIVLSADVFSHKLIVSNLVAETEASFSI